MKKKKKKTLKDNLRCKSNGNILLGLERSYPSWFPSGSLDYQCKILFQNFVGRSNGLDPVQEKNRISFLQENARPHTVRKNMGTIRKIQWDLLPYPPYNPDIAPSDFLFGRLISDLEGVQFEDNDAVISYVQEWVRTQPRNFWEKGIKQLLKHWKKYIEVRGDYFER